MGILKNVVSFVEGVIDGAAKRTTPRFADLPAEAKTPRQIMAEQFDESALDPAWPLDMPKPREVFVHPLEQVKIDWNKSVPEAEKKPTEKKVRDRRPRVGRGGVGGPSFQRLLTAYETRPELAGLVADVREGKKGVTEALVEAGLEKPRTRVGNMTADWVRATHEERREFLALVMDKNLFDKPAHSGWLMRNPGFSTVPDGMRGEPTEVKD